MIYAETEHKRERLWAELLEAIDRDDGDAFRAALEKREIPVEEGWTKEEYLNYCGHFVLTHSDEEGLTLLRIMDAIKKYCPGDYSAAGRVCPLSHWELKTWE